MPYRQPVRAPRAQSAKKRHYFDLSTDSDSRIPVSLHSQCDALPTPPSSIDQPESNNADRVDRPGPSHADRIDQSKPLESSDHLVVRDALAKMDPEALLDQIDKPERPKWQTIIEG